VRARTLAKALRAQVQVSVRGTNQARSVARRLRLPLLSDSAWRSERAAPPDLVVIDDPNERCAAAALARARRWGTPVASVHDLGRAAVSSDLVIDGSIVSPLDRGSRPSCKGPLYALLDPQVHVRRAARQQSATCNLSRPSFFIALGGGPRAELAAALARAIAEQCPAATVRVAGGFSSGPIPSTEARRAALRQSASRITWIGPRASLIGELEACDVAVVAGGVTLYEACALGTPAVSVAVVPAQMATITGFARAGAVLVGGRARRAPHARRRLALRIAGLAVRLIADPAQRTALSRRGRLIVDGRGAWRVARALRSLVRGERHS
jgi:spore coat polysaccharide biosynthesis predicted glycosyltransferase SpsG